MKDVILLVDNKQVIVTDSSSVKILICNIVMFLLKHKNKLGFEWLQNIVAELIKINV